MFLTTILKKGDRKGCSWPKKRNGLVSHTCGTQDWLDKIYSLGKLALIRKKKKKVTYGVLLDCNLQLTASNKC